MTNIAPEDLAEDIMRDTFEALDADGRIPTGQYSVEQINKAAHFLGEITEAEYQRNQVALNKLAF